MRKLLKLTLKSYSAEMRRAFITPLLWQLKDDHLRLVLLRCLFHNSEYQWRIIETLRFARRDAKLRGYSEWYGSAYVADKVDKEVLAIHRDMCSSLEMLLAKLTFNKRYRYLLNTEQLRRLQNYAQKNPIYTINSAGCDSED